MSADSLINHSLDGFKLLALLGRGGMARVYQGIDTNLDRYVAIKVIDTPHHGEAEYIKRFRREAQVIAQLNHPNVVQIYHYGETDGYLYIAMQYIQGADLEFILSDYHKDGEFIGLEEAVNLIRDIAGALDYIHSRGVIHRDVKPSNILLTREGRAILSDFGLALLTDVGTLGEIFGSPEYISPEQAISSAKAGPRSDQYSLGVIAYEMFTGRLPFKASEPLDLAMQHVTEMPPKPRQLRPDITPEVEEAILKALSKKPEDRYPSCAAFIAALSAAVKKMYPDSASTPPTLTHITIPERVKLHRVAHPLPPIPKSENNAVADKQDQTASTDAGNPQQTKQIRLFFGAIGLFAIMLICLCGSGIFLYNSFFPTGDTPVVQPTSASLLPGVGTEEHHNETPISSPTATAKSETPIPPATATNTPTSLPDIGQALVVLVKDGDKSIFVVNHGPADFPLGELQLGNPPRQVSGELWDVIALKPGECVSVWNNKEASKNLERDEFQCDLVGEMVERQGRDRFWTSEFNIYYLGEYVTKCAPNQKDCEFQIEINR